MALLWMDTCQGSGISPWQVEHDRLQLQSVVAHDTDRTEQRCEILWRGIRTSQNC